MEFKILLKDGKKSNELISNADYEQLDERIRKIVDSICNEEKIIDNKNIFYLENILIIFNAENAYIVRDRFGETPIFYLMSDEKIYVSNKIHIFKKYGISLTFDDDFFLKNIFSDCFSVQDDKTSFLEVKSLTPSSYLRISLNNKEHSKKNYSLDVKKNDYDNQMIDEDIKEKFKQSIIYLKKENNVGFLLSGGFDSSLILEQYERYIGIGKNKIFSITKNPGTSEKNNDSRYVEEMLEYIDKSSNFIEVKNKKKWNLQTIDELVFMLASPIYDERFLTWYNLFLNAKEQGVKTLVGGEGADELWYGYYPMSWGWISQLFHEKLTVSNIKEYYKTALSGYSSSEFLNTFSKEKKNKIIDDYVENIMKCDVFSQDDKKALMLFMVNHVLRGLLSYSSQIASNIELKVYLPFLNYDFSNIALNISSNSHLGEKKAGKDILKKVFKDNLPLTIIERKKAPLPKHTEINTEIETLFFENLSSIKDSSLVKKFFNLTEIEKIKKLKYENFYGNKNDFFLQLISLWRLEEIYGK